MIILIDDKEYEVETANWETNEEIFYPKSCDRFQLLSYTKIKYFIDFVCITVNKNLFDELLKHLCVKNEYNIEFEGKVNRFCMTSIEEKEQEKIFIVFKSAYARIK